MKRSKGPRFRVGQVVFVHYSGEYCRVVRVNKFSAAVGTTRMNVPVEFRLLRSLTARESGQRRATKEGKT